MVSLHHKAQLSASKAAMHNSGDPNYSRAQPPSKKVKLFPQVISANIPTNSLVPTFKNCAIRVLYL